jgi:hypothetical protein
MGPAVSFCPSDMTALNKSGRPPLLSSRLPRRAVGAQPRELQFFARATNAAPTHALRIVIPPCPASRWAGPRPVRPGPQTWVLADPKSKGQTRQPPIEIWNRNAPLARWWLSRPSRPHWCSGYARTKVKQDDVASCFRKPDSSTQDHDSRCSYREESTITAQTDAHDFHRLNR